MNLLSINELHILTSFDAAAEILRNDIKVSAEGNPLPDEWFCYNNSIPPFLTAKQIESVLDEIFLPCMVDDELQIQLCDFRARTREVKTPAGRNLAFIEYTSDDMEDIQSIRLNSRHVIFVVHLAHPTIGTDDFISLSDRFIRKVFGVPSSKLCKVDDQVGLLCNGFKYGFSNTVILPTDTARKLYAEIPKVRELLLSKFTERELTAERNAIPQKIIEEFSRLKNDIGPTVVRIVPDVIRDKAFVWLVSESVFDELKTKFNATSWDISKILTEYAKTCSSDVSVVVSEHTQGNQESLIR